jgi:uncharacterized protein (DUF302 family)
MRLLLLAITMMTLSVPALATDGMVNLPSQYSVRITADRLVNLLEKKGMTVFSRSDHAAGAQKIGLSLRPTTLVIFGNPKIGSLLMQCRQSTAIDLPQKALIWQDAQAKVWLSYNDPAYLKKRHQIKGCDKALQKITGALGKFAHGATSR